MPISYLISVTTEQMNTEILLAIFNIAGKGHAISGFSNGTISTDLWVIPKGKSNKVEVAEQLQAIAGIHKVSVVALSNPVSEKDLVEVRNMFSQIGWDTSNLRDEALLVFINTRLQGQYTYYIDHDHTKHGEGKPIKINIKPIEEHPGLSPDWLKASDHPNDETPDKIYTIDDIEMRSITIEETVEEDELPPPPPDNMN